MNWREVDAKRRFDDLASAARSSGAQRIDGIHDDDLVLITAEEFANLTGGTVDDDPLRHPGPPYFDDLELPNREVADRGSDQGLDA